MEFSLTVGLWIALAAFVSEYVDSSLGMGYGTTLAPVLLLVGFEPLQVVPAVLVSEFATGLVAAKLHQAFGNVRYNGTSPAGRIALLLAGCGALGAVAAVTLALQLPRRVLGTYIGLTVFATGVLILVTRRRPMRFSWGRLVAIGVLASFNKGIGGGGYGGLITGGQILSGLDPKASIGVASLAESIVSLVGMATYVGLARALDWQLTLAMLSGALLSAPFAAFTVKKMRIPHLRLGVALAACVLGLLTMLQFSM